MYFIFSLVFSIPLPYFMIENNNFNWYHMFKVNNYFNWYQDVVFIFFNWYQEALHCHIFLIDIKFLKSPLIDFVCVLDKKGKNIFLLIVLFFFTPLLMIDKKGEKDFEFYLSFICILVGPKGYTLHLFRVLMITKQIRAIWY